MPLQAGYLAFEVYFSSKYSYTISCYMKKKKF